MPSPEKKRTIADFFKKRQTPHTFPTKSIVPQKRRSPTPEDGAECAVLKERKASLPLTPKKERILKGFRTPKRPSRSPLSLSRSDALPFRSPGPTNSAQATPSSVRKELRRYEDQIHAELRAEKPTPKKQTTISFTDAPKATQSVVKDGQVVAIRDSEEDDSDSLASLNELFGFKNHDDDTTSRSSPSESDEDAMEADRVSTLKLFTQNKPEKRPGFQRLRSLYAQQKTHIFDIGRLMDDHFEAQEADGSVQKSRDQYEASKQELEGQKQKELDKELLASLIESNGGDGDEMARLMDAVSRTEALATEKSFSFFGLSGMTDWGTQEPPAVDLPESAIPCGLWRSEDEDSQSRHFLSGFVSELASRGKLNDSFFSWACKTAVTESNDYLRGAYVDCLKRGSSSWTRTNLTSEDVQGAFETLGADIESIRTGKTVETARQPIRKDAHPNSKYFISTLDMFQTLCQHMDFLALGTLAFIVCRLAIDAELMSNGIICSKVEDLLSTLLDLDETDARVHVTNHIFEDLGKNLHDPVLQALFLSHLQPTSDAAIQLRLKLSHAFLRGYDTISHPSPEPFAISLAVLAKHVLTSPAFNTHRSSSISYTSLRARAYILDTAISDGGTPDSVPAFNRSVDALADALKITYTNIQDTGASHMKKTEAKDDLQAIYWRLLYAIRTELRPKKHIFDADSGKMRDGGDYMEELRTKDFMKGFLAKARKGPKREGSVAGDIAVREHLMVSQ